MSWSGVAVRDGLWHSLRHGWVVFESRVGGDIGSRITSHCLHGEGLPPGFSCRKLWYRTPCSVLGFVFHINWDGKWEVCRLCLPFLNCLVVGLAWVEAWSCLGLLHASVYVQGESGSGCPFSPVVASQLKLPPPPPPGALVLLP